MGAAAAITVPHNGLTNPVCNDEGRKAKETIERLEKELRVRDDIIHELEVRLTLPPNSDDLLNGGGDTPDYTIEMKNLQTQLEALQTALAHKDNEIDALKVASEAAAAAVTATTALNDAMILNNG